ncbi:MAG: DUF3285 domain-containing protein [Cyanobacteria bacterium P01_F01_bin.150]
MTDFTSKSITSEQPTATVPPVSQENSSSARPPSYVKLAMRNMVRKGGKSLFHFFLTATGLIGLFIGLSYLTR